ncbi:hypothetical protein E0H73_41120 [Kribbella pittospori]|uniref:Uncharacterized protein n=1 Tax=Kribbella pittospori TaxID=722689 RepID=A0A4R0JVJ8_9ACTN|nr:hypothetical protein E0H73_41120 [Kribbella pittospori]
MVARSTATQEPRWVVYCFGGASRSMPTELLDTRFGVVTALNRHSVGDGVGPWREVPVGVRRRRVVGDPTARVRRVSGEVRDVFRHRMDARADSASPLQGLRFDKVSDLLRSLSVRTNDELMRDVDGGRGVRFTTYVDSLDDFVVLAEYLVDLRQRTDYKADWGWIDQIVPVATRAEADGVLREIVRRIGTPDEPAVDLVLPDWAAQNEHASKRLLIALPGQRGVPHGVLTSWQHLRGWIIKHPPEDDDGKPVLRSRIRACLEGLTSDVESVAISDLIVAELKIGDRVYVVSDGEVYLVEEGFLKRLDDELERIPWSTFPFPDYRGGNEPDYLDAVKRSKNPRLAVIDRLNVKLPGETAFEACDLLTDEGTLTFAKMKGRSSTFSHLCTQAVVSAEMLVREPQVRVELLTRAIDANARQPILDAIEDRLGRLEAREQGCLKICLLLLGTWRGDQPSVRSLPLVSRLLLQKTWQRISEHGFELELASPAARVHAGSELSGRNTRRPGADVHDVR